MSPKTVVGVLLLFVALLGIGKAWSNYQDKKEASVRDIRVKVQSAKARGEKQQTPLRSIQAESLADPASLLADHGQGPIVSGLEKEQVVPSISDG